MTKKDSKVETSLVLRSCRSDMTSQNNFIWPCVGGVAVCPDWKDNKECGNGLHGWLYGQGDATASSYLDETAKWLVVEVETSTIVMLGGKVKFPRGTVRFVGDKTAAAVYIIEHEERAKSVAVIGASLVVGDQQTCIVGYRGTATAGDSGTATAGYSGTATAGYRGTATAGYRGEIRVRWWDEKNQRYRTVIGYVGEDGIEANVAYKLDHNHKLVKA